MTDHQREGGTSGDGEAVDRWIALFERGQKLTADLQKKMKDDDGYTVLDPSIFSKAFFQVASQAFADPGKLKQEQAQLSQDMMRLAEAVLAASGGPAIASIVSPRKDDRRFADAAWTDNPVFNAIKQYYLLIARWLEHMIGGVEGVDPKTKRKAEFYLRQTLSALAPTNFVATNPKVLKATLDSRGENLRKGITNLLDDLERGRGHLQLSLTDTAAFTLGQNIATTPGKVVYQNDLMQLLQYQPSTARVNKRPLLIVPPWINKYYILDLQPRNSFIKWAVDQGHTVFVISWVNPDARLSHKRFDDYLLEGPLAALDAITEATGETEVNAVGYCIGGTLLACTLAHMAAKDDHRIASATFLTTMIDFSEPGDLGVFIDDDQIERLEKHMEAKGYLEGRHMSQVFSLLRENDLIWSTYVNNYLLGRDPPAFDLLYWNADSTRMPAMMHRFYLREMYLRNRLIQPGALTLAGTPIDISRIAIPVYILATREDHIAPWRSTFAATRYYSGPVKFVLAASGHIAGVINPPSAGKYQYWTNARRSKNADTWLAAATAHDGSWWPDWQAWVARRSGGKVKARVPGSGALAVIEDAPGSYAKVMLADAADT